MIMSVSNPQEFARKFDDRNKTLSLREKPRWICEKILVIGASGQIGVELTLALRKMYGNYNVNKFIRCEIAWSCDG